MFRPEGIILAFSAVWEILVQKSHHPNLGLPHPVAKYLLHFQNLSWTPESPRCRLRHYRSQGLGSTFRFAFRNVLNPTVLGVRQDKITRVLQVTIFQQRTLVFFAWPG